METLSFAASSVCRDSFIVCVLWEIWGVYSHDVIIGQAWEKKKTTTNKQLLCFECGICTWTNVPTVDDLHEQTQALRVNSLPWDFYPGKKMNIPQHARASSRVNLRYVHCHFVCLETLDESFFRFLRRWKIFCAEYMWHQWPPVPNLQEHAFFCCFFFWKERHLKVLLFWLIIVYTC